MYRGRQQVAQELRAIMLRGYIERGPDGDFVETQELIRDIIRWVHNDPEAARQVMADVGGGGKAHRVSSFYVPYNCQAEASNNIERTSTHA